MSDELIQEVPISDIELVPLLRKSIDQERVDGLMRSIQEVGLLYPVRLTREGEKYAPADGFHRTLALMKLGRTTIPAIIESKPLSEGEKLQKGLIANAHRVENTPLEKAEAIVRLMELTGWNASIVAGKLGLSKPTVSRLLSLLDLPEPIRERMGSGEIPLSAASELAWIGDGEQREALASRVASGRLTRDGLVGTLKARCNGSPREQRGASRVVCRLASATVTVSAEDSLDLESFISTLEEILTKARRARTQGIELSTLTRMFRDQAGA